MEYLKIKIHSVVDLITNSSTTIYTKQDDSLPLVYNILQDVFNLMGLKENPKDIIKAIIICDTYSYYYFLKNKGILKSSYKESEVLDYIKRSLIDNDVEWLSEIETENNENTYLFMVSIDSKFDSLLENLKFFLNSPVSEETYE